MLIVIDVQYLFNEFYFKDHQRVEWSNWFILQVSAPVKKILHQKF